MAGEVRHHRAELVAVTKIRFYLHLTAFAQQT